MAKKANFNSNIIIKWFCIILGTGILAFGLFNIHQRCGISEGGVLGLSLLIYHWFGISPGISGPVLDFCCFGLGMIVMGKEFLCRSVLASVFYAVWFRIFETMGPVLPDLTARPFAAALTGALFIGVGCGLVVRHDCAAGGDDALALSVNKYTKVPVSVFYFCSDAAVLLLSLSYIPVARIGWSVLSVFISSLIIELLRPKPDKSADQ